MTKKFESVPAKYIPIDRTEEEVLEVSSIIVLNGTNKEKGEALQKHVQSKPYTNQISNESDLKVCYQHGFRPYGQELTWDNTLDLLKKKTSICMTININTKPSYKIELNDNENKYMTSLIGSLNQYHEKQLRRRYN
ncbi:hypothetical protein [Bacillus bombysepticus]|uniref:hypothetical protein n=1 Tax=Bacillus bombysepticus TaxID=658666 RepID=UPI0030162DDF